MNKILEQIQKIGIVPVVVLENAAGAVPLAKALIDGGLPCTEVTFRTDAAEESIRLITKAYPDMLVGAGTVLTTEQVDRAIRAGAAFIVSPGFNPEVVKYCVDRDIPITPGTSRPTDIEAANIDVADRIGSGDAYIPGVLYGLLAYDYDCQKALEYGNATGAVKNTIPGDMPSSDLDEIERIIQEHKQKGYGLEMSR